MNDRYLPGTAAARGWWVATLLFSVAGTAQAAWLVEPTLEVSSGYDDNVRLQNDEEDALVSSAAAQARFRNVTQVSEFAGVIGASYVNYSQTDDEALDDEDAQFFTLTARRDTERARFGFRANGRRSEILRQFAPIDDLLDGTAGLDGGEGEQPDIDQGLDDALGDDDIDLSATIEQVRRTDYRLEPYLEYQFGERTSGRVTYEFSERTFDNDGETVGLRDSTTNAVRVRVGRSVSPLLSWGVTAGAERLESEGVGEPDREADNYTLSVGFDRQLTEQLRFGGDVGATRTEGRDVDGEETSLTYGIRLSRDMELSRLTLRAVRSTEPSSFGSVVTADRINLRYQRTISDRLEFGADLYAYRTERLRSEGDGSDERDYVSVEPRLTWRLTDAWNLGARYRYRWTDRQFADDGGGTADSSYIALFLSYQPPRRL